MREEHFGLTSKPTQPRYEVVAGRHRTCKLPRNLLDGLSAADQEQARAAIDTFSNRRELVAFSMHQGEPRISLRGEKWTKIDGVKIFFFIDKHCDFVVFFLSIDEFDDDGGGQECLGLIGGFDLDPATLRDGSNHEAGLGCATSLGDALSAWSRVANECAVDWVVALSRVLLADQRVVLAVPVLADLCLKRFTGVDSTRKWHATILANELYCRDVVDISIDLKPVVLNAPIVWLEEHHVAPSSAIGTNASTVACASDRWLCGPGSKEASNEELCVELTLTDAPSGVRLLGLELAYLVGRQYLSAYIQLAAGGPGSSRAMRDRRSPPPAGRLRVLLHR